MNRQKLLETLKLIALCMAIVCMFTVTISIICLASAENKQFAIEQKQFEEKEYEREQTATDAQILADMEVRSHIRERKVLIENGRLLGWEKIQEPIAEYNRWVIEKQTEVNLLGQQSPYYYTSVMGLSCIVGWGRDESDIEEK